MNPKYINIILIIIIIILIILCVILSIHIKKYNKRKKYFNFNKDLSKYKLINIIPIGRQCHSSALLKNYNLRKIQYIFDWAFSTTFEKLSDILNNNFEKIKDKSKLSFCKQSGCTNHSDYGKKYFTHYNYIKNYSTLVKRVNRTKSMILSDENKIFLHINYFMNYDKDVLPYLKNISNNIKNTIIIIFDLVYNNINLIEPIKSSILNNNNKLFYYRLPITNDYTYYTYFTYFTRKVNGYTYFNNNILLQSIMIELLNKYLDHIKK